MSCDPLISSFAEFMGELFSKSLHSRLRHVIRWIARRASDSLLRAGDDDQSRI